MYLSIIYIQNCMLTEMHGVRLWSWHINCFHYYYINVSQQSCGAAFNVWQLYFVFLYVIICRWYKFIKEWPDHLQKFHTIRPVHTGPDPYGVQHLMSQDEHDS